NREDSRNEPTDPDATAGRGGHLLPRHPGRCARGARTSVAAGSQPEHRGRRLLPAVFGACGLSSIIPTLDRPDAAALSRHVKLLFHVPPLRARPFMPHATNVCHSADVELRTNGCVSARNDFVANWPSPRDRPIVRNSSNAIEDELLTEVLRSSC